jgi:hypothetical protein
VPGTPLLEEHSPQSNRRLVLEQSKSTLAEVRQHLVRSSAALNHVYASPAFAQRDQRSGARYMRVDEGQVDKVQQGTLGRIDSSSSLSSEKDRETRVLSLVLIQRERGREGGRGGGREGGRGGGRESWSPCNHARMWECCRQCC